MAINAFNIKIDVSKVEGLADTLGKLTPEHIGEITVDAINSVADSSYALSRKTMLRGIKLTDEYLQKRMELVYATAKSPTATILARGGRSDLTSVSRYGAMQLYGGVNNPNRSKGTPSRNIPARNKSIGVSIEVNAGSRKHFKSSKVFLAPTGGEWIDSSGNPLVFRRLGGKTKTGKDKLQALTGPSVYQLFRTTIPMVDGEIQDDLEARVLQVATSAFEKELT